MGPPVKRTEANRLLSWKDILPWQRDNEFILSGYRRASLSYVRSLRSIFEIHNETANIWTHLLGTIQFLLGLAQFLRVGAATVNGHSVPTPWPDMAAVGLYYLCVVVCFVLSTTFHTFSDHSAEMHRFGNELDHLGIVLVIWGTGVSSTYFAFYCHALLRVSYALALTATAVVCGIFTLRPRFRQPDYRTARFLMYCFLGGSMFAPIIHGSIKFGTTTMDDQVGLGSFFGLAAINFSGAALYAARIPERWFPRTFDLLGQSHNWMHVLVFAGALVRLGGLLRVSEAWQANNHQFGMCNRVM